MADLPLLFVKILVNPKGLTAFCALIKTKSAHDKLQSIKNAWSKDEICRLEMAALLTQGNSESDKYRFNTAFLTGSDYYRYPIRLRQKCAPQSRARMVLSVTSFDTLKYKIPFRWLRFVKFAVLPALPCRFCNNTASSKTDFVCRRQSAG